MKHHFKIILLLVLFLNACSIDQTKKEGKAGEEMIEISAKNMQGKDIKLSDSKERVKILVFFQNGCSSCLKELPMLDQFMQDNKEKIIVYAINSVDKKEIIEILAQQLDFKNVQVLQDNLKITAKRYSIFATPTIILIKDSIIQERILGEKSWDFIKSKLLALL